MKYNLVFILFSKFCSFCFPLFQSIIFIFSPNLLVKYCTSFLHVSCIWVWLRVVGSMSCGVTRWMMLHPVQSSGYGSQKLKTSEFWSISLIYYKYCWQFCITMVYEILSVIIYGLYCYICVIQFKLRTRGHRYKLHKFKRTVFIKIWESTPLLIRLSLFRIVNQNVLYLHAQLWFLKKRIDYLWKDQELCFD